MKRRATPVRTKAGCNFTKRRFTWQSPRVEGLAERRLLTATAQQIYAPASYADNLFRFGNDLYFTQSTSDVGEELWVLRNGAGTPERLTDIAAGSVSSNISHLTEVNGTIYFSATDGDHDEGGSYGQELWRLDSNSARGASIVADINPNISGSYLYGSSPDTLTNANGVLYFNATDGSYAKNLYRYDGSGAVTKVNLNNRQALQLVPVGDTLYVQSFLGPLFVCDANGTATQVTTPSYESLVNLNGELYFVGNQYPTGDQIWKVTGTTSQAVTAVNTSNGGLSIPSNSSSSVHVVAANGTLYFGADDNSGTGEELWAYDPAHGARLLSNINADQGGAKSSSPQDFTVVGNRVYFTAKTEFEGTELYYIDGPNDQAHRVADLYTNSSSSYPANLINVNGTLFFTANDGSGTKLWTTNGTATSTQAVVLPYSYSLANFVAFSDRLFFTQSGDIYEAHEPPKLPLVSVTGLGGRLIQDDDSTPDPADGTEFGGVVPGAGTVLRTFTVTNDGTADLTLGPLTYSSSDPSGFQLIDALPSVLTPGQSDSFTVQINTAILGGREGQISFSTNVAGMNPFNFQIHGAVNTAPTLDATLSPTLLTILEDAPAPVGKVGTLIDGLVHLTGSLKNVTDVNAGAVTGVAVTAASTSGTWFYSTDNGTTWTALGSVGVTSARLLAADGNTRIYFKPNANLNGTLNGVLLFRAWDRTSGTNGGLANVGVSGAATAFSTASDSAAITITAVNDAPVLDTFRTPALAAILEDASTPAGPVGTLVNAIIVTAGSLKNVSDGDVGAVAGMAIVGADVSKGSWYYSLNNGTTWTTLGTVRMTGARLLAADGAARLYFKPKADFNGSIYSALSFRAWDRTQGGASGAFFDPGAGGGSSAFSAQIETASIQVKPVNDAPILDTTKFPALNPVGKNAPLPVGRVGTLVDALIHASGSLKNMTDVDAASIGIAVTKADTTFGTWYYSTNNGTTWLSFGSVSTTGAKLFAADGQTRLYFRPKAGYAGTIATALTFRAWDRSTGANAGTMNVGTWTADAPFSKLGDTAAIRVV
jgi:ELWxxDGT repeat protein